jgi:hypothetical protein
VPAVGGYYEGYLNRGQLKKSLKWVDHFTKAENGLIYSQAVCGFLAAGIMVLTTIRLNTLVKVLKIDSM